MLPGPRFQVFGQTLSTAQRQHVITIGHIPPRPGAFEPRMANELMSRLNPPTAQGIPRAALGAIINPVAIVLQVSNEGVDRSFCSRGGRPQPLQAPEPPVHLTR